MTVATPFVKRRQQVPKPRGSPDMKVTLKPLLLRQQGQHRRDRQWRGSVEFGRGLGPGQRHRTDCLET